MIVENIHIKVTRSNGYFIRIADSGIVEIRHAYNALLPSVGKLKISNTTEVIMSVADAAGEGGSLSDSIEIDSLSHLTVNNLYTLHGTDSYPVANLVNTTVRNAHNDNISHDALAGWSSNSSLNFSGANRLTNPSFEAGTYGWSISDALASTLLIDSPVGTGKALRVDWDAVGQQTLTQSITISPDQVGIPLTFTALVNCSTRSRLHHCSDGKRGGYSVFRLWAGPAGDGLANSHADGDTASVRYAVHWHLRERQ